MPNSVIALSRTLAGSLLALTLLTGCPATTPTINVEAQPTDEGLYEVTGTSADEAWARGDVDMAQYSRVMIRSIDIEYRPGGETRNTRRALSSGGPFLVTEEQKELFRTIADEEIPEEVDRGSRFALTAEPGSDVLLLDVQFLDLVSNIPPDAAGREDLYISEVGEATVVLELRDSTTGDLVARTVERRTAEGIERQIELTVAVTNEAHIRRLFSIFGRELRERLGEIGSLGT